MAQSEDVLWEILKLMRGNIAGWNFTLGGNTQKHEVENAYPVSEMKSWLVLKYLPSDIEDTIYFMKHRGYLVVHGQGIAIPEIAYSMSEKAIAVFEQKKLPAEEKNAFKESLWSIEPKLYGIGPNMSAWKRLLFRLWRIYQRNGIGY